MRCDHSRRTARIRTASAVHGNTQQHDHDACLICRELRTWIPAATAPPVGSAVQSDPATVPISPQDPVLSSGRTFRDWEAPHRTISPDAQQKQRLAAQKANVLLGRMPKVHSEAPSVHPSEVKRPEVRELELLLPEHAARQAVFSLVPVAGSVTPIGLGPSVLAETKATQVQSGASTSGVLTTPLRFDRSPRIQPRIQPRM